MDSDHFSFFFNVIDSGPGVVTHRRSFYACVLFKINAQRGTTERDEMMMFSFDSFVYRTRTKNEARRRTLAPTPKKPIALPSSPNLSNGSSETKTETVREFTRAFTLDQCVRFRNWFKMTKNASVCCLSFEIFCAFLKKGECNRATRYARSAVYRRALDVFFQKERV